jgi:hypothetical protein
MTRSQLLCSGVLISALSIAGFADTPVQAGSDQPATPSPAAETLTAKSITFSTSDQAPARKTEPVAQPVIVTPTQITSSNGTTTLNLTIVVPAQQPAPPVTLVSTEQFENGSLHWADVSAPQIELFLRDLNHRRDYDFSQHNEQPGPNHNYLTSWITQSVQQLIARGYTVDAIGDLHRADHTIVATR